MTIYSIIITSFCFGLLVWLIVLTGEFYSFKRDVLNELCRLKYDKISELIYNLDKLEYEHFKEMVLRKMRKVAKKKNEKN